MAGDVLAVQPLHAAAVPAPGKASYIEVVVFPTPDAPSAQEAGPVQE